MELENQNRIRYTLLNRVHFYLYPNFIIGKGVFGIQYRPREQRNRFETRCSIVRHPVHTTGCALGRHQLRGPVWPLSIERLWWVTEESTVENQWLGGSQ